MFAEEVVGRLLGVVEHFPQNILENLLSLSSRIRIRGSQTMFMSSYFYKFVNDPSIWVNVGNLLYGVTEARSKEDYNGFFNLEIK